MTDGSAASIPLHIVVTDDDPRLLATLTTMLREAGHTVYTAYNGWIARQLAAHTANLDLLVTNTRLADLGAPELIREIRAVRPELAVLHIGLPLPGEDRAFAGVTSLPEPFTRELLLAAVTQALDEAQRASWRSRR